MGLDTYATRSDGRPLTSEEVVRRMVNDHVAGLLGPMF